MAEQTVDYQADLGALTTAEVDVIDDAAVMSVIELHSLKAQAIGALLDWEAIAAEFLAAGDVDIGNRLFDILLDAEDRVLELARRIRTALAIQAVIADEDEDDDLPY